MAIVRLIIALVALLTVVSAAAEQEPVEQVTSPMVALSGLPKTSNWHKWMWPLNAQWRLVRNDATAGGDFVVIRFFWKAGQYAAVGFSPVNMAGFITACNVPAINTSAAVCTDVIGHNGGGVTKNPNQYSRLLWAKTVDASDFVELEVEIPLSAVNVTTDAMDGSTRLIFATSTWNSTSHMPEPHNAYNKIVLHVQLAKGEVAARSLPIATAASHIYQATPDFAVWWYLVYNTTVETSYAVLNYQLSDVKKWGGIAIAQDNFTEKEGVVCYYDTTAICVDVVEKDGKASPAAKQYSKITSSESRDGVAKIYLTTPLPAEGHAYFRTTSFASGPWDTSKSFPLSPTDQVTKLVRFSSNEMLASDYATKYQLFPTTGMYTATWAIVQEQSGFLKYKMRAALQIGGDHYVGIGLANTSMGGPLVACHMPQSDALQVVCKDFIGQVEGGVKVNPEQSTEIVAAIAESGMTKSTIIVDIDLAKFNVSAVQAMNPNNYQRMIFAYGTWDSAKDQPTYHGPNATFFDVNIFTGKTNGTAPPTVTPHAAPTAKPKHHVKRF